MNGELLRSVNCSNVTIDRLSVDLFPDHFERLVLTANRLHELSIDRMFNCESLTELHVTDNSLRSLYPPIGASRYVSPSSSSAAAVRSSAAMHGVETVIDNAVHWAIDGWNHKSRSGSVASSTSIGSARKSMHYLNHNSHGSYATSNASNQQNARLPLLAVCHRLRYLDVSGNALGMLVSGAFKRSKRLDQLKLDRNRIHTIERHAFAGLNQLRMLSLKHNLLVEINSEMFQNLNALRVSNESTSSPFISKSSNVFRHDRARV